MLTNTDVTIFNTYTGDDEVTKYIKTLIPSVNWQEVEKATVTDKKLSTAKEINIFIPVTSIPNGKTYIGPKAYANLSLDEVENYFTFSAQDKVYKGNYEGNINSSKDFNKLDDIATIMTVEDNRIGSLSMRHFMLGCE